MKKFLLLPLFAALFAGCLAKKAQPYQYYEITYKGKICEHKIENPKSIYVSNIQALNLADSRDILIVDFKNNIRYLQGVKFVTLPSEMVYKAIVSAVASQCEFRQSFTPKKGDFTLRTEMISLQVNGDQAEMILGYDLLKDDVSTKSGIIKNHIFVPDPSAQTILKYMDISVNQTVDKLISELK
ncbi:hypothetical protein [Campylobacter geochelonis]|uniref:50S ribosomal protein L5 (BL6) n=1 Tax=Campylobacter geochelonis TaxID=1780362 RepID=A0A128EHH3_9BACT|nr:hypothetical protein [Campylobacter geochelonis]QKF71324.1 putative lipid asymmetry ABC transporter MlaABCDEF component MlaB [Campylobacter geochelonis]CZE48041.1 50S ribosomal protein L5 (BL6) [Campylobacter geochelonis]CZE48210.1 50S ribosomal protein L5 (BL6) [Campylobacter geochelonis]CZE51058.1 50S ribosomal protein L5 (BL6) [Campylobacter geochelonis]